MRKNIPALKTLLGIHPEDEKEIQRRRTALQSYHPRFHRNVRQWAEEYGLVEAGQEPLLDGFFDAIIGGSYDEHFQATLHRQALHWHHLQLNEDRILLLLSHIWQELLHHSESLGSPQLPRSLCLVIEMARIIAIRTVSLSRKMWAIKERAEHEAARIHQAFSLLATNLPDDLVQAYADHQQWMYRSISLMLGEQPAARIAGSSECNLARWLAGGGRAIIPAAQWEEFGLTEATPPDNIRLMPSVSVVLWKILCFARIRPPRCVSPSAQGWWNSTLPARCR